MRFSLLAFLVLGAAPAWAQNLPPPLPAQALSDRWPAAAFFSQSILPAPFSFQYGDRSSPDFLGTWVKQTAQRTLDANRLEQTVTFTDPANILQVRCVVVQYRDFPVVEWTLHLTNIGAIDTRIISHVQAIDTTFPVDPNVNTNQLHYFSGGGASTAYEPFFSPLAIPETFTSDEPVPNQWLPYFNLDGDSQGVCLALGWAGSWKVAFKGDPGTGWRVQGGMKQTHFLLHPQETVSAPLVAVLLWQGGDWLDGQNLWRRWMLAHNLPNQPDGQPQPPRLVGSGRLTETDKSPSALQLMDGYRGHNLKLDAWWLDRQPGEPGFRALADGALARHLEPLVSLLQQDLVSGAEAEDRVGVAEMKGVQAREDDIASARHRKMDGPAYRLVGTQPQFDLFSLRGPLHLPGNTEPPETEQARLATLALWDPDVGGIVRDTDGYAFRSAALWQAVTTFDTRQAGLPYDKLQALFHHWRVISPLFLADYYPLANDSKPGSGWRCWEFNDPKKGLGVLQAFRSAQNSSPTLTVKLRGIDAAATYELTEVDQNKTVRLTGAQLIQTGYTVTPAASDRAPLVEYGKVQP